MSRFWNGLVRTHSGPVAGGAVARLLGRDDADGDMPRADVVLEAVDHAPAVDVGQADIQGDGVGLEVAGHGQRGGAAAT